MSSKTKWARPAVWAVYVVVVLEFLFMISPFALHFYSAYGPALNFLHRWPATAWLTGFFLPHFSFTGNPVLDGFKTVGFLTAAIGILGFLVGAVQIYGGKLLGKGAITGGLYRWVRHPQYTALAVLGFGIVLIWPRFLVLLSYLCMLLLYYVLARVEEERCLASYGEGYREYMARTGRILPLFGRRTPVGTAPLRFGRTVAFAAATLVVGLGAGLFLRHYSLSQITADFTSDTAVLSPAVLSDSELESAYRTALTDPGLRQRLRGQGPDARFAAYVVPATWFMPDLPLHSLEEIIEVGGGHRAGPFDRSLYKVLFTKVRLHGDATGRQIVTRAFGQEPVLIVHVDTSSGSVLGTTEPPDNVYWGDIPTPMF